MSTCRVLPSGGPLNAPKVPSLSLQAVDRPNPNAKFSHKSHAPQGNVSQVFAEGNGQKEAPRTGKRCVAANSRAPSAEASPRPGLRISRFDEKQAEAARKREDTFRPIRRISQQQQGSRAPSPVTAPFMTTPLGSPVTPARKEMLASTDGTPYSGGRKSPGRKNMQSDVPATIFTKDYASMDRFKHSQRISGSSRSTSPNPAPNVLRPETLPSHLPAHKAQRFRASPEARATQSLVGVFGPDPDRKAPPAYTPRAPFHTD